MFAAGSVPIVEQTLLTLSRKSENMSRDIWLDDDEPGCLECGEVRFTASRIDGVCVDCANDAFNGPEIVYFGRVAVEVDDDWLDWNES